jgi:hypothetical protein
MSVIEIPFDKTFQNTKVGGFGIDYDAKWDLYLICDDDRI